jgi:hypothetical protein
MTTVDDERAKAIAATETTCPRCGTPRDPDQRYCLECGLALPAVTGRIPSLRRRWLRRLGWYPGDWVWTSILTLVVAVAGAAVSIAVTHHGHSHHVVVPPPAISTVSEPTTSPATVGTSTLPTAPEPGTTTAKTSTPKPPPNGRLAWPAGTNGWTIVLVSYPKTIGRPTALQTAAKAAKAGLRQVGVLDSSLYASLQPGYFVVFTGVYGSKTDADTAVSTARQAGFAGAYSRQVAT